MMLSHGLPYAATHRHTDTRTHTQSNGICKMKPVISGMVALNTGFALYRCRCMCFTSLKEHVAPALEDGPSYPTQEVGHNQADQDKTSSRQSEQKCGLQRPHRWQGRAQMQVEGRSHLQRHLQKPIQNSVGKLRRQCMPPRGQDRRHTSDLCGCRQ